MSALPEHIIDCPYCDQSNEILIEFNDDDQDYIEDCQVCCQPIRILVQVNGMGETQVLAKAEDDV